MRFKRSNLNKKPFYLIFTQYLIQRFTYYVCGYNIKLYLCISPPTRIRIKVVYGRELSFVIPIIAFNWLLRVFSKVAFVLEYLSF